jgi:hypothetical protein
MELRDIAIIFVLAIGVLALKGVYDVLITLPPWVFYLAIGAFVSISLLGFMMLLGSMKKESDVKLNVRLFSLSAEPKRALSEALSLWTSWPWWAGMLFSWKVFEPWTVPWVKVAGKQFGFDLAQTMPVLGSPLSLFSLAMTYSVIVIVTALITILSPISLKGKSSVSECQRCKAKHSIADNYCSNCGAILPKGR